MNREIKSAQNQPPVRGMTTFAAVIIVLFAVSGCTSLPLAVQIAALVGSGASYMATGKTLTDHAVSSAFESDCRLFRALNGNQICEPPAAIEIAETSDSEILESGDNRLEVEPRRIVQAGRYAVIGSFSVAANAERWATRHQEFDPRVYTLSSEKQTLFRVIVGPLNELSSMLDEQFELAGIGDSWKLDLCPDGIECTDG